MVGINHNEKEMRKRRQDITQQYLETGSIYVFLTKGFLINKNRYFGKIYLYEISQERVFETDKLLDLKTANIISLFLKGN